MASLAMRNLFHDRVRLGVTLVGIIFSVVSINNVTRIDPAMVFRG